jgi:small conductance mechanosensitive channel
MCTGDAVYTRRRTLWQRPSAHASSETGHALTEPTSFLHRLANELRRSLTDTLGVLGPTDAQTTQVLAMLLNRVIVSVILIGLFLGIYLLLRTVLHMLIMRFRLRQDLAAPLMLALRYMVFVLSALAIMSQFGFNNEVLGNAARAAVVAFLFYLGWVVATKLLINLLRRYHLDSSLEQLFRNVVSVLIVTFGFVSVMSQFNIDVLSIVTALGVVGIAVGFAAQSTLSNFIAGITLLIERPFRIGEWVEINGQVGKVIEISLRMTRLRTRDNIHTLIPNANVVSTDIINLTTGGPLRVRIPVGIAYKESVREARAVLLPVLEAHENVLRAPGYSPSVRLMELADSSVNLDLLYWITPENIDIQPGISAEILEACKEALDRAGIEIPFPHLQLFIDDAKGLRPVLQPLYDTPSRPAKD